jgi:hypothetical protein
MDSAAVKDSNQGMLLLMISSDGHANVINVCSY